MKESKRALEPVERTSEILFGLIIVLTFTCSFGFGHVDRGEVHAMLIGMIGCSLAWGIIDAALYLVGCLSDRGHKLLLLRQVRQTSDSDEARQIIADALPPLIASHLRWDEYGSLQRELSHLPEPLLRPGFTKADWQGALEVFLLVFGSILPMVIRSLS
jgi:hypothetical protein